jgi:hypothetical protein
VVGASVAITAAIAALALYLGAWAYDTKRYSIHDTRLRHLVEQRALVDQVVRGLEAEGSPLLFAPKTPGELRRAAGERGRARVREILEKGERWPQTRVFVASDMVYFLYFDAAGVMKDYTCVSR